jgi:hypothetical protein
MTEGPIVPMATGWAAGTCRAGGGFGVSSSRPDFASRLSPGLDRLGRQLMNPSLSP